MCDRNAMTPSAASAASTATKTMVQRQSAKPPIIVPIGAPRAVDIVRPVMTTASA
jgi:hypothetical protein